MREWGNKPVMLITYAAFLLFIILQFDTVRGVPGMLINIASPVIAALCIALVLNKSVDIFQRLYGKGIRRENISRGLAVATSYILLAVIVFAIIMFIVPQLVKNATSFAGGLAGNLERLEEVVIALMDKYNLRSADVEEALNRINGLLQNLLSTILDSFLEWAPRVVTVTGNVMNLGFQGVVAFVISVYLLAGKKRLLSQLKRLNRVYMPTHAAKTLEHVGHVISDVFGKYVVGQLTEAAILGGLCFAGMTIFRFEYALLISTLTGVTALFPVVGAWIGASVGFLMLALVSPMQGVLFLIFLLALQQIEGNLIYPHVVGGKLGLPGLWVMLAVTIGSALGGILGILVGVPVVAVLYTLVREDLNARGSKKADAPPSAENPAPQPDVAPAGAAVSARKDVRTQAPHKARRKR